MTVVVVPAGGLAKVGGSYATYSSYGRFLDDLGARAGGLELYGPVIEPGYPEYEYHAAHVLDERFCRVIPLPAHPRGDPRAGILKNYTGQLRIFLRDARQWRHLLVYTPSVTAALAVLAWRVLRARPTVAVAYVWGDWQRLADVLPQPGVLRRLLDPIQRRFILRQEDWLVRHADATFVAGPALLRKYDHVGRVVTETVPMINLEDLAPVRQAKRRVASRLLFVGRLVPGKGIETLIEALALLKRSIASVSLRIVGGGDPHYVSQLAGIAA